MTYQTLNEAYLAILAKFLAMEPNSSPRGLLCREALHARFRVLQPRSNAIVTRDPTRNDKIAKYTLAEFKLYADGVNDAEAFAKHAPFWRTIANPDGTISSAYGRIIWFDRTMPGDRTPWEFAREALRADRDTRQAVLVFAQPRHYAATLDRICTLHGVFHIRDGALHFGISMRSNDVVKGLVYDGPWFCYLMERMRNELLPTYPDLKLGTYTHDAASLHLYESDVEIASKMVEGL